MCQLLLCLNALSSFFFVSFIIGPRAGHVCSSLSISLPLIVALLVDRPGHLFQHRHLAVKLIHLVVHVEVHEASEAGRPRNRPTSPSPPALYPGGYAIIRHRTSLSVAAGESRGRRQAILDPRASLPPRFAGGLDALLLAYFRARRVSAGAKKSALELCGARLLATSAADMPETGEQIATAFATPAGLNATSQVCLPDKRHVAMGDIAESLRRPS